MPRTPSISGNSMGNPSNLHLHTTFNHVDQSLKLKPMEKKPLFMTACVVGGALLGSFSWSIVIPYIGIDYFVNQIAFHTLVNNPHLSNTILFFVGKNILTYTALLALGFTGGWITIFALDVLTLMVSYLPQFAIKS